MKTMDESTTLDRPTSIVVEADTQDYKSRSRWLMILSAALVVAVVAMGAWLIFGDGSATDLTAEQEQMLVTIDDAYIAMNDGDGAALAALYTPNGYHDNGSRRVSGTEELTNYFDGLGRMGFSATSAADPVVVNDFVISSDYIGADTNSRTSFFRMTSDGTQILWHYAP